MMVPKIIFRYSEIYDGFLKAKLREKEFKYPSEKTKGKILNYINEVEKLWKKDKKKILKEISKITKLNWKEKEIYCYVVGKCIPFSDPLTISIYKKELTDFIDTLVHELIHRLFAQEGNFQKAKKAWNYIKRKYKDEDKRTKIHIPLYAIYTYIFLKFYGKGRLKKEIERIKYSTWHPESYKRAWQIVQKQGYKKIIEEFVKRIKA